MKAAVLREINAPLSIEQVQIDNPKSHEVLVRTAACGVCRSDLHYITGHYAAPKPTILGHEAAGVVEKVGSEVTIISTETREGVQLEQMGKIAAILRYPIGS